MEADTLDGFGASTTSLKTFQDQNQSWTGLKEAGFCNLFKVLVISFLLFKKDTMGSLTATDGKCWQMGSLA